MAAQLLKEGKTMDTLLDYTDQVVLITGAASGFGKLLAHDFSSRGANVVLGDINLEGVQAVADNLPGEATVLACDVSKEAQCKNMVDTAIEKYGKLDIAINNAGIAHGFTSIHMITDELMDQQFNVNVKGVVFGMKYQLEAMASQGSGIILNVSSMAGLGGAPKSGAYCAAKHAVIGITKTAAIEYAKAGIRVNAVCPFFTLTPMVKGMHDGEAQKEMEAFLSKGSPMKRLGEPQEITNVMLMLCSPGNTYMNGQCIAIDGGVSAF